MNVQMVRDVIYKFKSRKIANIYGASQKKGHAIILPTSFFENKMDLFDNYKTTMTSRKNEYPKNVNVTNLKKSKKIISCKSLN